MEEALLSLMPGVKSVGTWISSRIIWCIHSRLLLVYDYQARSSQLWSFLWSKKEAASSNLEDGRLALQITTRLWRCTHPAYFTISSSLHIITTALLGAAAVVLLSGCLCFILLPSNEICFQWFLFGSNLSGPESQEEDQNHRGGIPNLTCAGSWRGESLEDFVQNHLNKGSTAGQRVYQQSEDFEPHVCPSINPTKTILYAI